MAVPARVDDPAATVRIVRRDRIDGARRTVRRMMTATLVVVALVALVVTTALFYAGFYNSAAVAASIVVVAGWSSDRVKAAHWWIDRRPGPSTGRRT